MKFNFELEKQVMKLLWLRTVSSSLEPVPTVVYRGNYRYRRYTDKHCDER